MSADKPRIVVVGSLNMDLVARAPALPKPGETVLGDDFVTVPGGKGANQAIAAARLGADITFIGRIGADAFGETLRAALVADGIDVRHVQRTAEVSSGVALIVVAATGENAICVASGANGRLAPADVRAAEAAFADAQVCLLQLEIPLKTAVQAVQLAERYGVEVVLDPAPAPVALPAELWNVTALSPNESEAARLLGLRTPSGAVDIARALHARGPQAIVLKRGVQGTCVYDAAGEIEIAAHTVEVVDSTAAGDAFTAGLAVARAEGASWGDAARFANAAGALACTQFGAQPSAPTRAAVKELLRA